LIFISIFLLLLFIREESVQEIKIKKGKRKKEKGREGESFFFFLKKKGIYNWMYKR
jgi:hypothetical protein